MIGEIDWFGRIVGGIADGEIETNTKIARALIRAGLAVVIIEPNGKKAVCTLNERDKKAANIAAQDAARAAGSPNWERVRHECGVKHAITDAKILNTARVKNLLNDGANLAIALGKGSKRVLVVDVDTAEERRAFLEDWDGAETHDEIWTNPDEFPMTVTSPGVISAEVGGQAVWAHKDGGHYWFDVPDDVELPERPGKLTWCRCHGVSQPAGGCRNSWAAYYGSGYVLVPPSVRPEGPYRLTGSVQRLPDWLSGLIRDVRPDDRATDGSEPLGSFDDDPIDTWSAQTSWADILTADGFTPADSDSCGCPTFTRPGDATHSKSVTAHEIGCTQYDTSKGHGPLHIWSDAIGGQRTLSKVSYMARFHHAGNMGDAMRALGIGTLTHAPELQGFEDDETDMAPVADGTLSEFREDDADPKSEAPSGAEDRDPFAPIDWDELFAEDDTPAEFLPGMLLERGQQASLIGDGKSGKSLLIFDWCIRAITGEPFLDADIECPPIKILYLDGENNRRDILDRARAFGTGPEVLRGNLIYLSFPPFKPLDSNDGAKQVMALVRKYEPDVVILDTVSRFVAGKENDSDTWLALYRVLHKRLKRLRVACVRLDHFGKDAEKGGRGSSAKSQDIDHVWELTVTEENQERQGEGIEVVSILSLKRTHTRTGLGPDLHRIRRRGMKRSDERGWLANGTSHEIADVFDSARTGGLQTFAEPERPVALMRQIAEYLRGNPSGSPRRKIRQEVEARAADIDAATEMLIAEGYVTVQKQGAANMHYLARDFPAELETGTPG